MNLVPAKLLVVWLPAIMLASCKEPKIEKSEYLAIDSLFNRGLSYGGSNIDSILVVGNQIYKLSDGFSSGKNKAKLLSGWHYLDRFKMDTSYQLLSAAEKFFSKEDSTSFETGWSNSLLGVGSVHSEFYGKLDKMATDFTIAEKRLAGLIRMNLTNSEIASILSIESKSVKIAKYRLKKKLGLDEEQSINRYLAAL